MTEIGRLRGIDGSELAVHADDGRTVLVITEPEKMRISVITLAEKARDRLRELLDRSAMPGQETNGESK